MRRRRPVVNLPFVILFVLAVFIGGVVVGRGSSVAASGFRGRTLLDLSTDEIPAQTRVHVNLDQWDPGAETGRHRHPGPTIIVLLEGQLQETLADRQVRALVPRHAYWKPARTEHNVKNVGAEPARAIAIHLDPSRTP